MANDSSLVGGGQFPFDLESQKGLLILLAAVRASELSAAQKNELRDLAFLYTNGGRDASVRISLQQKVIAYGLQPLAGSSSNVSAPAVPPPAFGTSRPAPSFAGSVMVNTTAAQVDVKPQPVPAPTSTPTPAPAPAPVAPVIPAPPVAPVPVVPEAPLQPVVEPVPVPPPPVAPAPQPIPPVVPEVVPTPPLPEVAAVNVPVAPVVPAEPEPIMPYDAEAAAQRIREIKSLVNEKVGNPVNLVDINNEVGREYMSALLDAMKKLSSGTSVISAMKRLEAAFVVVEETLKTHEQNKAQAPDTSVKPVETPAVTVPVATPPAPPAEYPTMQVPVQAVEQVDLEAQIPVSPFPQFNPEPVLSEQEIEREVVEEPDLTPEPIPEIPEPVEVPINRSWANFSAPAVQQTEEEELVPTLSEQAHAPARPIDMPTPVPVTRSEHELESAWGPATDTLKPDTQAGHISSLAEGKDKLRSIDELPRSSDLTAATGGDPLLTKEVDDGLQQLLSEWVLFKKSGLFGTGPKGREHPLFKKISGLQIPLLLAGRFEGATQEIKQSITDYMNGWRYEQGIIYEQGETFEHYLRRVIRHIIDLQKRRQNP